MLVLGGLLVANAASLAGVAPMSPPESGARSVGRYAPVGPSVTPTRGGRRTTFRISFTSHARLGRHGDTQWSYSLDTFEGNGHPQVGCDGSFSDVITRGQPGQRLVFVEPWNKAPGGTGCCISGYRGTIHLVAVIRSCSRSGDAEGCRQRITRHVVGRVHWVVGHPKRS